MLVISLSPFFTQENVDLIDSIQTLDKKPFESKKYYRFGIGNDYPSDYFKMDSIIHLLSNSNLDASGFIFKEADHNVTPGLTIGVSLYEIFEKWSNSQSKYISNEQKNLKIIDSLKEEIMTTYGSSLAFSLGVLNGKGWSLYNEKEYEKAIEAWRLLMKTYPNFSEGYLYIISAQIQLNQDFSETIKQFKKSLTNSDIYSENESKELIKELESVKK